MQQNHNKFKGATVLKNAAANVANGLSSMFLALGLPYVLARHFDSESFALWVLLLQVGAYANYLNFGVQTAVGRYVARAISLGQSATIGNIASAGLQLLAILAGFALIVTTLAAAFLPSLFPQIHAELHHSARISLMWIGASYALALPFSALLGVFIGQQRNEIPAYLTVGGRAFVAAAVTIAAVEKLDLVGVSIVFFASNLLTYIAQWLAYRRLCAHWPLRIFHIDAGIIREITKYCLGLTVWSVSMLLVSGIGTTLVGMFDFPQVAPFGIALTLVTFLAGIQQAVFSPLIQIFAAHDARGEWEQNIQLMLRTSVLCSMLLVLVGTFLIVFGVEILGLWVGAAYARQAYGLLCVLVLGNVIRYSATPYAMLLVGCGRQRQVLLTPFAEGVINFVTSLVGVLTIGAIGVAVGTVMGALAGIACNLLINFPRTLPEHFSAAFYFRLALLEPAVAGALLTGSAMEVAHLWGPAAAILMYSCAAAITALWALRRDRSLKRVTRSYAKVAA